MACLRRPSGTKPNSEEERQQNAVRIPADLKEEGAPSREAEDAGQYRMLFCNCCMAFFEQGVCQRGEMMHLRARDGYFPLTPALSLEEREQLYRGHGPICA